MLYGNGTIEVLDWISTETHSHENPVSSLHSKGKTSSVLSKCVLYWFYDFTYFTDFPFLAVCLCGFSGLFESAFHLQAGVC